MEPDGDEPSACQGLHRLGSNAVFDCAAPVQGLVAHKEDYIWIYHPALGIFSYYAHLKDVHVELGQRGEGGAAIATLGRTGTNAYPSRSPTHLHLMLLRAKDMTPVDAYPLLAKDP